MSRPQQFDEVEKGLSPLERRNIAWVRGSLHDPRWDRVLRWCQRVIGAGWIHFCTKNLLHVYGKERLPTPEEGPFIWVSNHRSFFDMFVANAWLFRHGFDTRVLYPVRANFFYDSWLGFFVNGIMSFWSMYPPIFRDRKRLVLNHTAFCELAAAVDRGRSVGIHPEGTRNKGDDPYQFLPAQAGVGRLVHLTQAPVVPFFINGLGNDLKKQVGGNFTKKGPPIRLVFGKPLRFEEARSQPGDARLYRAIAEQCMHAIGSLGQEEEAQARAVKE